MQIVLVLSSGEGWSDKVWVTFSTRICKTYKSNFFSGGHFNYSSRCPRVTIMPSGHMAKAVEGPIGMIVTRGHLDE